MILQSMNLFHCREHGVQLFEAKAIITTNVKGFLKVAKNTGKLARNLAGYKGNFAGPAVYAEKTLR